MGGAAPRERKCQGRPACQKALPAPDPCCSSTASSWGAVAVLGNAVSHAPSAGPRKLGVGWRVLAEAGIRPLQTQTR